METVLWRYFFYLTGEVRPTEYVPIGVDVVDGVFENIFLVNVIWMKQTPWKLKKIGNYLILFTGYIIPIKYTQNADKNLNNKMNCK